MTTREFLEALANRGVPLTYWKLRGLIHRGTIPKPRMNSSLAWTWSESDLDRVAAAVKGKEPAVA